MITALNMTVKLKQDPESLKKLQGLKAIFADRIQPEIDRALRKSRIVHFVRVLVIDDKYLQVLTEFDGDPEEYTEFFRRELPHVFRPIFELAEGVPPWDELNDQDTFFQHSQGMNIKALGRSTDGREGQGWLFSYFGKTVREIEDALARAGGGTQPEGSAPSGGDSQPGGHASDSPKPGGGDNAALHAAAAAFTAAAAAFTAAAGGTPQGEA